MSTKPVKFEASGGVRLTVDYGLPLVAAIGLGRYDWADRRITEEHFPVFQRGTKEIIVEHVSFGCNFSSEDVVKELRRRLLRRATLAELLAYGAAYPEEQRRGPLIALGSVAEVIGRSVPGLYADRSGRVLGLGYWRDGWSGRCRFLVVRPAQ